MILKWTNQSRSAWYMDNVCIYIKLWENWTLTTDGLWFHNHSINCQCSRADMIVSAPKLFHKIVRNFMRYKNYVLYCFQSVLIGTQLWWHHQMETFSALLALCVGNSPLTSEFPSQRPMMWNFDVFFDMHRNKCLSKQSWGWWFETPLCSLRRNCNESCC